MRDASRRAGHSATLGDFTGRRRAAQELASALAEREVLAEQDRIARDLHDLVIQRLFVCGMSLQHALTLEPPPEVACWIEGVIDELDASIAEIRSTIFGLEHRPLSATGVRAQLLELASKAASGLGFEPRVRFVGPVDASVPDDVAEHALAVVREALSNVVRHAHASQVDIVIHAGSELVLEIADDGRGLGEGTRRSGLANLAARAEAVGGAFELTRNDGGGTRLQWRVPLESAAMS